MKIILGLFFLFLSCFHVTVLGQGNENYVSFHLKNETLRKGKLLSQESDYYFDIEKGNLVVSSSFPKNHIKTSNRMGEVKLYYPDENTVLLKQNQYFSSENELIYYFISNNFYDLGLAKEGFSVSDTRMDGNNQLVTWAAPTGMKIVAKVELVFEDNRPIFAAYYNANGIIIRRIYYYNYEVFRNFMMPLKVTQISYLSENDSVIQRNTWSSIKLSASPTSEFFNFKIPENAKITQ